MKEQKLDPEWDSDFPPTETPEPEDEAKAPVAICPGRERHQRMEFKSRHSMRRDQATSLTSRMLGNYRMHM